MRQARHSVDLGRMVGIAEAERRLVVGVDQKERMRLYRAVDAGKLMSPFPKLYARREYWQDLKEEERVLHVMRALQTLHPSWAFAGPSAALARGLWVSRHDYWPVRIAVNRHAGCRYGPVYRQTVEGDSPEEVGILRVTSLGRTVFDCLREMSFERGLAVADSALRLSGRTQGDVLAELEGMPHNSAGYRHALDTARHADPRAESGGESLARARLLRLGYELPELQVVVPDVIDGRPYRGDLGWKLPSSEDAWLLVELDGREKYVNPAMTGGRDVVDVLRAERLRESRISAKGTRVMRLSFADMMDDARFVRLLDAYGAPKAQAALYVDQWERHRPAGLARDGLRAADEGWLHAKRHARRGTAC